ncbi:MAG: winged helix-turn-helix transcriptional regulator [Endomicrobiales bacterium]|nr:winged helix-turn-helix transcriptional regulator [Endomicrobiales bacterium]
MPLEVSEKEFAVIREIHNNHLPDQRTIATRTGISLGLTNLIIKKLIKKGYVKAKQLNQKKIQYLLTPKGFSEKAKKSYNFTVKTINMLTSIRKAIQKLISEYTRKGFDVFELSGGGEMMYIAEIAFKNTLNVKYTIKPENNGRDNNAVITAISSETGQKTSMDLIDYLSDSGLLIW